MDFLVDSARPKILRTALYDDQEFHRFELELLHTPIFQRLYDLKQLGYADRVFPDAVHSRFNHLVGVAEVSERMARRIISWLDRHKGASFTYSHKPADKWLEVQISAEQLADLIRGRLGVVRLIGLLHDITHGAFGHTLEDEVSLFTEKHDDPDRQIRFFDALIAQLVTLWAIELRVRGADTTTLEKLNALEIDNSEIRELARNIGIALEGREDSLKSLITHLRELEYAFRLLLSFDEAHRDLENDSQRSERLLLGRTLPLLVSDVVREIEPLSPPPDLVIHRDLFLIDIVGNTICADLIDYARRDATNAGLKATFDQRLIRYVCTVSVSGEYVPGGKHAIRAAIQIFTNKLRNDVLTEMSLLLKARYLISERITFHPTKCAAGACLGTAVQLLGLTNLPPWVQALGDQTFLRFLIRCALAIESACDAIAPQVAAELNRKHDAGSNKDQAEHSIDLTNVCHSLWPTEPRFAKVVEQCLFSVGFSIDAKMTAAALPHIQKRARAAQRVLWRLSARRYPKLAYRLHGANKSGAITSATLATKYSRPDERYELERKIERTCNLPIGTVHVHCPIGTTSMKAAKALVVGSDLTRVTHLRTVTNIYDNPVELLPYQDEIQAVERMYKSIWNFHVYVDVAHMDKRNIVAWVASKELKIENDPLLKNESDEGLLSDISAYDILAERNSEFAFDNMPKIIEKLDQTAPLSRFRRRGRRRMEKPGVPTSDDLHRLVTDAIRAVGDDIAEQRGKQIGKPNI
jgi:HD superfamily phosphohydrolase